MGKAVRDFDAHLNLNGNEVRDALLELLASNPSTATAGRIVFVTADNTIRYGDGTNFKVVASTADLADYQKTSGKGVASGYASLGTDGKVPLTQLTTGNAVDAIVVLGGALTEGQSLIWDGEKFIGKTPVTVYTPKGSVATYDALPTNPSAGDVYNVEAEFTIGEKKYPAGTNVAWVDIDGTYQWDPLGGIVDLSGYQLVSNLVTALSAESTDAQYPSAKAVYDALQLKADADEIGTLTEGKVLVASDGAVTSSEVDLTAVSGAITDVETLKTTSANLLNLVNKKAEKVTPTDAEGTAITGATAGTKVTVNTEGIVTKIEQASSSDLSDSASLLKTADVVKTAGFLASTSDEDVPSVKAVKDAIADVAGGDIILTGKGVAVITDADGKLATSEVTSTEIGYLDGVTSNIQTQIDSKVTALETKPTAGTYTKVTISAEGLVTAGASLSASDIPDISATYIPVAQKGVASGVAELNSSGQVPLGQITADTATAGKLLAVGTDGTSVTLVDSTALGIKVGRKTGVTFTADAEGTYVATIAHELSGAPVAVSVFDASGKEIYMQVETDGTNITLSANSDPGTVQVRYIG